MLQWFWIRSSRTRVTRFSLAGSARIAPCAMRCASSIRPESTSATTSACTVDSDSGMRAQQLGQGLVGTRAAARGLAQRDGQQALVVLGVVAQTLARELLGLLEMQRAQHEPRIAAVEVGALGKVAQQADEQQLRIGELVAFDQQRGQQLARGRVLGDRPAAPGARSSSAAALSSSEPLDLRAVKQQVGVLRKLRETFLEDAACIVEAAAFDEIERLLGEDGGVRGLVVHGLNDA